MKVHEIMTAHARSVGPENTLVEAAGLMRELDVGVLPVCENDRLSGIITDRDLVLRATADGRDPNSTSVRDVMTPGAVHVFADQDVEEAVRLMEERQIRRLPVLNREERLVGIMSLGDVAISSNPAFSGMALRDVSEPRNPNARQRHLAERSEPAGTPELVSAPRHSGTTSQNRRAASRRRSTSGKESVRLAGKTRRQRKGASRTSVRKSAARSRPRKTSARAGR